MALDLGLHRALEKLADEHNKKRTEEEERNLGVYPSKDVPCWHQVTNDRAVVSARIWLCLYWFDHQ